MLSCSLWFLTTIFLPCLCRWNPSHCFAQPRRQVFTSTPHVTTLPWKLKEWCSFCSIYYYSHFFFLIHSLLGIFFSLCSDASKWLSLSPHPFPPDTSLLASKKSGGQCYTKKRTFFTLLCFPDSERRKQERDNLSHSHCLNLNFLGLRRRGQMWGA